MRIAVAPVQRSLKDQLFNVDKVAMVATRLQRVQASFRREDFIDEVMDRLGDLELKQRIRWISEVLERHLPGDYRPAVGALLRSLPAPCDPTLSDGDFGDFIYAAYSDFVARRGCTDTDLAYSLDALKQITTRFSAEDAIRTFINAYPGHTMDTLIGWTRDEHYHVRRLCSEGTRPRLPWARRLSVPASAAIPILDNLFDDRTRFVTRSVANHLNDIAKSDPDLVVETLRRWRTTGRQEPREMNYIVRHATRTLVKAGHRDTLDLLGVDPDRRVTVTDVMIPPTVHLGAVLDISITVHAVETSEAIVDYVVHFAGPSGRPGGRKVYKLRRLTVSAGNPVTLVKTHPLRAGMSTRTIHPGEHAIEVLVNGTPRARRSFQVVQP
ncbi:3-methyladenine DNA glycosylase AlkC [Streptosporangium becharense]|uniref:3-methyladenine DNA glycosylase AlkC n=1 Tax=Streptosporangium becharense TaxID=1816182 RepID=A0A7W9IAE8_9ACTN|nr:DNA alkylation repair protein [Streptosporangium becharense]MBB2915598.1 3-methyladenine DNA glycosylase AlkC [Streptosporangium becharense]MBB5817039.1 3-methyladenine DNA glycosylase AlkC [Streptosporangium becharense]